MADDDCRIVGVKVSDKALEEVRDTLMWAADAMTPQNFLAAAEEVYGRATVDRCLANMHRRHAHRHQSSPYDRHGVPSGGARAPRRLSSVSVATNKQHHTLDTD